MDLSEIPNQNFSRHPWELARARFFLQMIRRSALLEKTTRVLDVGSGDAYFAQRLLAQNSAIDLTCWDSAYTEHDIQAKSEARFRKIKQQPAQTFDLVLMMDVLEHVDEDIEFLRQIVQINMRPGSLALISVPAWHKLYSEHDKKLFHHRRYAPRAVRSILSTAGLQIQQSGGLFHSLLPVRVLQKSAELFKQNFRASEVENSEDDAHGLGIWQHGPFLTRSIQLGLGLDNWFSMQLGQMGAQAPGLSWWALCTKQAS